ncbi:MAG: hypothetical protein ACE5KE_13565 [Methanosarcinales archaeon]
MNPPKIDLKKVYELEKDPERIKEIMVRWAKKSLNDHSLPWEKAMQNAAEELGLNKAELATLIYANKPFDDLAYALGIYETWRMAKFERDRVIKEFGLEKLAKERERMKKKKEKS